MKFFLLETFIFKIPRCSYLLKWVPFEGENETLYLTQQPVWLAQLEDEFSPSLSSTYVLCDVTKLVCTASAPQKHVLKSLLLLDGNQQIVCFLLGSTPQHIKGINPQGLGELSAFPSVPFYGHRRGDILFPYSLIYWASRCQGPS